MAKTSRRGLPPHKHWRIRAADYRELANQAMDPELRRVLDHLTQVCDEMAKETNPAAAPRRAEDRWIHPKDVARESTAERWRIREAEYRAIADSCAHPDGQRSWRVLADRCKTLAFYLEEAAKSPQTA
jgi:hypothetical protein